MKVQKSVLYLLLPLIAMGFYWVAEKLTKTEMPASEAPPLLYSNQTRDDLTLTLQEGIKQAKQSVLLIIYTLTDQKIVKALQQKSEEGVSVMVICDGRASPFVERKLGPRVRIVKRFGDGIMHLKILVIDDSQVWIGSANMTGESLRMHGNLILGFYSPALGQMITQKAKTMPEEGFGVPFTSRSFLMGGQKLEMWFLPDNPEAASKITSMISSAKKTLRVAMFTWTRMDFAEEVVKAFKRGVDVSVALDRHSGQGASSQVANFLKKNGVPLYFNQDTGLLHHKFMEIDNQILVNGSANWTKAAFAKNDDCFVVLHDLTVSQQKKMDALWKAILRDSKEY